jgi:hypothetical protein
MPGLAMLSSAKGTSLSTTTARFIGTFSALDGAPRITRSVSADTAAGTLDVATNNPIRAAFINLSYVM